MRRQLWNEDWKFWKEKDAFSLVWDATPDARTVTLPHDAMIGEPARKDSVNGSHTGGRDSENLIYEKELVLTKEQRQHHFLLEVDGAYMNAFVYVNGQLAAKRPFGYTVFYADLDPYLRRGTNQIRIVLRAGAMPNSRWYSGAGLYRDVYLLESEDLFIVPDMVRVTTEQADVDYAVVRLEVTVKNRRNTRIAFFLTSEIYDPEKAKAAGDRSRVILLPQEVRTVSQRVCISGPALWSEETPNLYRLLLKAEPCEVAAAEGDKAQTDFHEERFGIRTLGLDAGRGLRVNGKTVKLRGACIHHDHGILGAATYREAEYRRIAKLKDAGFNAIRCAHHPAAKVLLDACDELGVYVMDEAFDMWSRCKSDFDYGLFFAEWWEQDLTAMVRNDYNHPSVILYSLGNEICETGTPGGAKICHDLCETVRKLDPTRFVLTSVNGAFTAGDRINELTQGIFEKLGLTMTDGNVNDFMGLLGGHMDAIVTHPIITENLETAFACSDVAGYNYMSARYLSDHENYPNRVIVGSETCPPVIGTDWPLILKYPHLIGDFTWTGWDYLGEAGIGTVHYQEEQGESPYAAQLANAGDLDITGFRRPASYYREIVFGLRKDPYIAVQPPEHFAHHRIPWPWTLTDTLSSWTWPGYEGKPIRIEVFADCDELSLCQDGKLIKKQTFDGEKPYRFFFETIYHPGELTAVAFKNGTECGRSSLVTAGWNLHLELSVDMPQEGANSRLVFLAVELLDDNRVLCMQKDMGIRVEIEGEAVLLGLGSADPCSAYGYQGDETALYNGRALLCLKKLSEKPVSVTVSGKKGLSAVWNG